MKKKQLLPLGILAVLVLAALIYTRPMTLQEIGKVDIAQCESVSGYHRRAPDSEFTSFELSAEDERCSQLIDLFAQQKYRRSLINLLSPGGGSTHRPKDGDFIWDLSFNFGPTNFPDGSTGKGTFIQCRDFYGTLRVFTSIDGKTLRCTTSEQEAFLQQVYDIISADPEPIPPFIATGGIIMKKCVSILIGVLAVIAAAAAVLVALDRFRKQTDEDPNDFED